METGHQGYPGHSAGEERSLYLADLDHFDRHPDQSEFVRRATEREREYARQFTMLDGDWDGVEWVLVRLADAERTMRIRIPLRGASPQFTDGDVEASWARER